MYSNYLILASKGRFRSGMRKLSMKTERPRHKADQGPIFCHHCGEHASLQLIYTIPQVAHLLKKSRGQVQTIIKEGKLRFRYQLKSGWTVRKVVDYSQLQKYLDDHLPKPEDLESNNPNTTIVAINRILGWYRKGQRRAKATMEWKKSHGAENPS